MGDQSSVLFIDRDPKYFPFILSYLRTGNVLIDFDLIKETDLYGIIQEAEYYKLDGMINEIKSNQNNPVPPAETKWSNGDIKKDYSSNSSKTDGEAHFINQSCRNSPRPAHKKKSHPSYQQIT